MCASNDFSACDIYDLIRDIKDPEFSQTLEELKVLREDLIQVSVYSDVLDIRITFVPTVPHCHLATLIGLCIRAKLERDLEHFTHKLYISIAEDSHTSAIEVTKQINDKERVAAALENPHLHATVQECIDFVND
ncbi:hypothetical protein LOD99_4109 [Oopsacas minuta]|uniref:MIP18 family-like domain-containing protein n=1 Tax=Oopsacas minuta TaxID=111878 RepID=A0AAV7JUN6_9METZ|nr:hypothetical protein LOD99_4109 [Oopsacas minuta]